MVAATINLQEEYNKTDIQKVLDILKCCWKSRSENKNWRK